MLSQLSSRAYARYRVSVRFLATTSQAFDVQRPEWRLDRFGAGFSAQGSSATDCRAMELLNLLRFCISARSPTD